MHDVPIDAPEPVTIRRCRDCDDSFSLSAGEIDFFVTRGLQLPKRCRPCRDARRLRAERSYDAP